MPGTVDHQFWSRPFLNSEEQWYNLCPCYMLFELNYGSSGCILFWIVLGLLWIFRRTFLHYTTFSLYQKCREWRFWGRSPWLSKYRQLIERRSTNKVIRISPTLLFIRVPLSVLLGLFPQWAYQWYASSLSLRAETYSLWTGSMLQIKGALWYYVGSTKY